MPRYFLDISYLGANYHGWQIQKNAASVQETLQDGLSKILGSVTEVVGSGRTDTGVHAKQQIVHFDAEEKLDEQQLVYKLNGILPYDISVNKCLQVQPEAHARFDAEERAYRYFIHTKKNPFREGLSYAFSYPLDIDMMNEAAKSLIGKKDFESFSKVKTEVNNFICEISFAQWYVEKDVLTFEVKANRFLRGMVRALVGTLLDVGRKKLTVEDFVSIIEAKDRTQAGRSVPPQGLYLTEVKYPKNIFI